MNNLLTCNFNKKDIDEVVAIHLYAFPKFFLTFLGPHFLRELYLSINEDTKGIAIYVKQDEQVLGFVFGSTHAQGLYTRLLHSRWVRFGWAAIPALIRSPSILPRLLRAFSLPDHSLPVENCATLMSIAVDPDCQGQGIGKLLVNAFLDEARKRGATNVSLTTDAIENEGANHFYESLGFEINRRYATPEGRIMNEYSMKLF